MMGVGSELYREVGIGGQGHAFCKDASSASIVAFLRSAGFSSR